jgi:hypothetical protein
MRKVIVNDKMQKNYSYILSEKPGENFHPEFKPELTPKQMLELGVFCGKYMRDCTKEFPENWFKKAKFSKSEKQDCALNYFKIKASQPLSVWRKKEWIHKDDPRGWFQWYCRYYLGRRHEDDLRQIKRWKSIRRHLSQLKKNCKTKNLNCRPKQRQVLLHWAIDSRKI